jgi:hypothetical protein
MTSVNTWLNFYQEIYSHIGPFVFTRTLLPLLAETSQREGTDVRIVNVCTAAYSITVRYRIYHVWQVTSTSHMSLPAVRYRNLDDFNREFKERLWPAYDRYSLFVSTTHSERVQALYYQVTRSCQTSLSQRSFKDASILTTSPLSSPLYTQGQ